MKCDSCNKNTGIQYQTEFGFLCDKCWDKLLKEENKNETNKNKR